MKPPRSDTYVSLVLGLMSVNVDFYVNFKFLNFEFKIQRVSHNNRTFRTLSQNQKSDQPKIEISQTKRECPVTTGFYIGSLKFSSTETSSSF